MGVLVPVTLELDEPLKDEEVFIGVKTVRIELENGEADLGYVGIIKNLNNTADFRYGNLRVKKSYTTFGDTVI